MFRLRLLGAAVWDQQGMDTGASAAQLQDGLPEAGAEQRVAPRFTLLIRAAKLVSGQGEFVCVIRDVSETGVSVRMFHARPGCVAFELHMPGGTAYPVLPVWQRDNEAGFRFAEPVDVTQLINESGDYPKRGIRLGLCFPIIVSTITGQCEGEVENISQQGARITCPMLLAIDQTVRIEAPGIGGNMREVRAKVRWRRGSQYGLVFDYTFTLGDFARLAVQLQAPALLEE